MEDLVGRKMIGFRFESDEDRIFFSEPMEKYVGREGEIISLNVGNTVIVKFSDGNGFCYPIELVEEHLIPEGVQFTRCDDGVKVQSMEEMYVSGCDSHGVKNNSKK